MKEFQVNKYELSEKGYSLGVKRLFIPYEFTWTCPCCEAENVIDYFDQPIATEENIETIKKDYVTCEECEYKEEFQYKVSINLEVWTKEEEE